MNEIDTKWSFINYTAVKRIKFHKDDKIYIRKVMSKKDYEVMVKRLRDYK